MKEHRKELKGVKHTGEGMKWLVEKFNGDVAFADDWDFLKYYRFVRDLPYIDDGDKDEKIARPLYLLQDNPKFRDCDDKSILIGCQLYRRGVEFCFVACAYKASDEIHHCVVGIKAEGTGKNVVICDATYPDDDFPIPTREYHNCENISGWIKKKKEAPQTLGGLTLRGYELCDWN